MQSYIKKQPGCEHEAEYRNEGRAWATAFIGIFTENIRWGRVNSLELAI